MASIPPAYEAAFQRWGYLADAEAHKYGLPNGATLLAKIGYVESRYNMNAVSSAGARAAMQFMPSTRQAYIDQYHIDPWANVDQAVHAAAIFMKTTGLAGYNPGSGSYISEVQNAPVAISAQGVPRGPARQMPGGRASTAVTGTSSTTDAGPTLIRFLVMAALVLGGVALLGVGFTRAAGSSPEGEAARRLG